MPIIRTFLPVPIFQKEKYRTINKKKAPRYVGEQLGFQFKTLEKWIYKGDHIK